MAIVSSDFAKALWPGVNAWYGQSYNEFQTEYDKIFTKETSRKAFEEDVGVSGFGLAIVKPEAGSISYDTALQGWIDRYQHVTYGLGFIISKELVEDDQYDVIGKKRAQALAMSMRQTKETVGANILNRAFNTSYLYGDGKALLVTDHPNIAGGTYSNRASPDVDISETSLEQMYIDMGKYTNDRGLRIAVKPQKLIVAVDNDFEANKIMQTEYEVGTANNTKNLVRSRIPGGVIVNHYLTDTDAWYCLTDVKDGLKYFERRGDSFDMDSDFDSDNAKYKATARYSFGCTDKRAIWGTQGA